MSTPIEGESSLKDGPLIRVSVGVTPADRRRRHRIRQPVPPAVELMALIDTGAECSCIDPRAVASLDLPLKGSLLQNSPGVVGLQPTLFRQVTLRIVHPSGDPTDDLVEEELDVADLDLTGFACQFIIGRDILARCQFTYNGQTDSFTLSY